MPTNSRSKKDRRSISVMLRSFFSRSNSRKCGGEGQNDAESSAGGRSGKRIYDKNKKVDFGIAETEKLTHFTRPKPPQNRRPPRASAAARRRPTSAAIARRSQSQTDSPVITESPKQNTNTGQGSGIQKVHPLYLSHSELAHVRRDQDLIIQRRNQAVSESVISKSVPNLLQDDEDVDDDDLSDILGEEDLEEEHESKKRSSIWQIFQRASRKSTASSLEDDDQDCTCQDQICDQDDSSEKEERSLETPEDDLDNERFISMVERRVKPNPPRMVVKGNMLRSETFDIHDHHHRGSGGGHYIQHRHSAPYTSYQEFIRVTHKSMPPKVVLS